MKHDTPWTQERRVDEQTQWLVLSVVAYRKTCQCCTTNKRVAAMACPIDSNEMVFLP